MKGEWIVKWMTGTKDSGGEGERGRGKRMKEDGVG